MKRLSCASKQFVVPSRAGLHLQGCRGLATGGSQYAKHARFLQSLGIEEGVNDGVCIDGKWSKGSGEVVDSVNPAYNETITRVATAGLKDYERAIEATKSVEKMWAEVRFDLQSAKLSVDFYQSFLNAKAITLI